MSGVCAKHEQYVQPGEVCPYCEPSAEGGYSVPTEFVAPLLSDEVLRGHPITFWPLVCDHRITTRDICDKCGLSGMAIAQMAQPPWTPVE